MPAGRPLKFESVEELQAKCDEYFEITPIDKQMITGLALHLDTCRSTLCDYADGKGERTEFSNTIKHAKLQVEYAYELRGMEKGGSFDIFRLKNMGWKDRYENDLTSKDKELSTLTVDKANEIIRRANGSDTDEGAQ